MTVNTERLSVALNDRYRIERALGAGGMATVYLAHDIKHDRHVAVKVLKPELAAVLGAERFVVEIKTTASLSHPHILPLFDSGTADGFLFYVMPFIEGETLRDKLNRESQLGVDEAVRITREIADALDYAHHHGVIHRDIKPENILLHDGRPMVADFGIALAVSAAAGGRMTETGLSLGTPHYMSPEQATAEKEITARSDIYSLASVLYEMLAGQPPHIGGTAQQIIMKIITQDADEVTEHRKSVPDHVAAALMKALQKLPADRFESARAFAEALAGAGTGGTISRTRAVSGAVAAGRARASLVRSGALVASGIAAGVLLAVLMRPSPTPAPARRLQIPFNSLGRGAGGERTFGVSASPVSDEFTYGGLDATGAPSYFIRSLDRATGRRLADVPADACCLSFSPTGDSIVFLALPHRVMVLRLDGGVPVVVADSGVIGDGVGGVKWAADGFLYIGGNTGTMRMRPDGSEKTQVTRFSPPAEPTHFVSDVLPGSRFALVTIVPSGGEFDPTRYSVGIADLKTGRAEVMFRGFRGLFLPDGKIVFSNANSVLSVVEFDARRGIAVGTPRELPDTAAFGDFTVAVDGSLIYNGAQQIRQEIAWIRRGSTEAQVLDLNPLQFPGDPRISRDGRRMLVNAGTTLESPFISMNLDGSDRQQLTVEGAGGQRAVWHPRRNSITYTTARSAQYPGGRVLEQALGDGSPPREIPRPDARLLGAHGWSPDGAWLILRTDNQEPGNGDILAFRPGVDTIAVPIAATAAEELAPAVSPDGRWLAYSSDASGAREIYLTPFPPREPTARYRLSSAGGTAPVWSRDGRELFYVDGALSLVSVTIALGPNFQAGLPRRLFGTEVGLVFNAFAPSFDVSADGQRFIFVRNASQTTTRLMIVTNFMDEVRAMGQRRRP